MNESERDEGNRSMSNRWIIAALLVVGLGLISVPLVSSRLATRGGMDDAASIAAATSAPTGSSTEACDASGGEAPLAFTLSDMPEPLSDTSKRIAASPSRAVCSRT